MTKISAGSYDLNKWLHGGYDSDIITTFYGAAGSGKTNFCLLVAVSQAKKGNKVIFIDTEGGFSAERAKQICKENTEKVLDKIFFFNPTDFKEQQDVFEKIKEMVNEDIKLIVVDTISMLYRLERGSDNEPFDANLVLAKQISYLTQIARKSNIPVLIANQVYADFENPNGIKIVGGDILKYGSKCLIELQAGHNGVRKATLIKHRHLPQSKELIFRIVNEGIENV